MPYDPIRGWYKTDDAGNVVTNPGGQTFIPGRGPTGTNDARSIVKSELDKRGLGALANDVWNLTVAGAGQDEINSFIRSSDTYKTRFAGMIARQSQGFAPISEDDYVAYENQAAQLLRNAGLPPGFYDDPTDFANLIGNNVSLSELNDRVVNGIQAVQQADPEVRSQLKSLYGVDDGQLVAAFLDPNRADPLIKQMVTGSQVAAQAVKTGFGQLTTDEANQLTALGVTDQSAASGFNALASNKELVTAMPGEGGGDISRSDQLAAAFANDASAQDKISRRQKARVAAQQSGGGAVTAQSGATGLGSAAS